MWEKAGDPWQVFGATPTLTETAQERTLTLIHDFQLEKHRQILKSCQAKDALWGGHSVPKSS